MKFVLGIDSGGTNYRVMACDLAGNQLGYYVGEPANLHYLDEKELLRRINQSIDECLGQFLGKREEACYLVGGATGIDCEEDLKRLFDCYKGIDGLKCPMKLMNDAELAHYTVTGGEGILILSGTGSIAFGKDKKGRCARAGGWPLSILGDEGSGTWVTKMALRHYARYLDHGVTKGPLIQKIAEEMGIKTSDQLIQTSLKGGKNPAGFPQLGMLVNQAAREKDPHALAILQGAARELMGIVDDIVFALDLLKTEPDFCVGVWGSNIVKSEIILDRFSELMKEKYPMARILMPEREAVEGAVSMALSLLRDN